jgi:hypothetical protein
VPVKVVTHTHGSCGSSSIHRIVVVPKVSLKLMQLMHLIGGILLLLLLLLL